MNEYTSKGGVARSHSNNGNLQDDGARIFQYDYKNRLVAVWDKASNTPRAAYLYYGDGRRAKTIVFSAQTAGVVERETLFFYDGWQVCEEQNAAGLTETTYVYGHYVDDLVQFQRTTAHPLGAGTFYSHCNARFDVVATSDASGQVVERRFYDDFGRQFGADKQPVAGSAVGNPYGFQGRRLDVQSGLYHFRHRYYDPETGRFVQRDPIWDPGNVGNQYSFVGNGPNGAMDPMGLSAEQFLESFIRGFYAGGAAFGKGMAALGGMIWGALTGQGSGFSKMKIDAAMIGDIVVGVLTAVLGKTIIGTLALDIGYALTKGAIGAAAASLAARDAVCSFAFEFAKGLGGALLGAGLTKLIMSLGKSAGGSADDLARAGDDAVPTKVPEVKKGCFLAGTLVHTRRGKKKIEEVQVGDEVLSRDEDTGQQGYKRVVRLFRGHTDQVVYLKIGRAPATQRGRSESHRVGEANGGTEQSDEPPLPRDDTQTIRCTTEHPFWVIGQGFVAAKDLRVGQRGLDSEGNEVVFVGVEIRKEKADHYNFEVEDWHTYFVSETEQDPAIWVHNDCWDDIDTFRGQNGLQPVRNTVLEQGDGLGTVAFIDTPAGRVFGTNTGTGIFDDARALGSRAYESLREAGHFPGGSRASWSNAGGGFLTHGEAQAVLRAMERYPNLRSLTITVDRTTCSFTCRPSLPTLFDHLGIESVVIRQKNADPITWTRGVAGFQ